MNKLALRIGPPVLPLPVEWKRDGSLCEYEAWITIQRPDASEYRFVAKVLFCEDFACWQAFVSLDGCIVYSSEHRERDEACGAAVVAMQRALDVRHPT